MKVYTNLSLAGQTLHLPVVGEETLDKEASLEIKDERQARLLIDKTKGSLNFKETKEEVNPVVKKKQVAFTNETVKVKSPRQRLGELLQEVGVTQIRQWIDEVFPKPETDKSSITEGKKEDEVQTQEEEEIASNDEEIANSEDIIEAIDSCESKEELLSLIELIPGVKKKSVDKRELPELKTFLINHVKAAASKKK